MRRAWCLVLGALVISGGHGPNVRAGQQQTFRAAADAVVVDVSVQAGRRPVTGLTSADFALADNGVPQTIDEISLAREPIDLELLVDRGGEWRSLAPVIEHDVASVRSVVAPGDRWAIVTFDSQVRSGPPPGDPTSRGEQGTVLFDAIAAALMQREEPGRRRVIVVVTAGIDTHSLLAAGTRRAILQRSEPPVYLLAAERRVTSAALGMTAGSGGTQESATATYMTDYSAPLREIADASGGRLFNLQAGDSFLDPLRDALAEFRTRYVLHYRPAGVTTPGWHELSVKVTRAGSFDVRARRGYWR